MFYFVRIIWRPDFSADPNSSRGYKEGAIGTMPRIVRNRVKLRSSEKLFDVKTAHWNGSLL